MGFNLRLDVRIDDDVTNEIHRFKDEKSVIVCDIPDMKLHRIKMLSGVLNTQEITITEGAIVEVGDPVPYVKA